MTGDDTKPEGWVAQEVGYLLRSTDVPSPAHHFVFKDGDQRILQRSKRPVKAIAFLVLIYTCRTLATSVLLEWNAKNKTSGKTQAKFSLHLEEAPLWKQQAADVVRRVSVFPG